MASERPGSSPAVDYEISAEGSSTIGAACRVAVRGLRGDPSRQPLSRCRGRPSEHASSVSSEASGGCSAMRLHRRSVASTDSSPTPLSTFAIGSSASDSSGAESARPLPRVAWIAALVAWALVACFNRLGEAPVFITNEAREGVYVRAMLASGTSSRAAAVEPPRERRVDPRQAALVPLAGGGSHLDALAADPISNTQPNQQR